MKNGLGPSGGSIDMVLLDHGSGGLASSRLIKEMFLARLSNPILDELEDSAELHLEGIRVAFSTDSYVVDPIFFPGGDIGELAVNGTINDLAMKGAEPVALSLGLILEEGFPGQDLARIMDSVARSARQAGVSVVTGDTKVVPRGKADKIFINTSGLGLLLHDFPLTASRIRPSDLILISGTVGDHGATIMTRREGLGLDGGLSSDTRPLHRMARALVDELGPEVRAFRDPTRGGLATSLVEMAHKAGLSFEIREEAIPVRDEVAQVCEILGLDPLYLANEGKMIAVVSQDAAARALEIMESMPESDGPAVIGRAVERGVVPVVMETAVGGRRAVEMLTGEPLPRIC